MKLQPRDYQQAAHDAVIEWWRTTTVPCVVEAATGAGKSLIVAMLAETLHGLSGKRVLCLAPSAELVQQNSDKFKPCGVPYSVYSASIAKSLRGQVIFATEGTFKTQAKRLGGEFAGVIVDECHRITPTVKQIIADMREGNPNLRVCGLSATPYRLGDGFIFAQDNKGRTLPPSIAREPYFGRLVYYINAPELIGRGYLTPPVVGAINAGAYDTSGLQLTSTGTYSAATVERAFEGWGRKTAQIVDDVLQQSNGRDGVMWFAATVQHAQEIMASLDPNNARMIGGDINTKKADRARLVADFKAQRFRHLVSVGTMTTGVDFTHVSCIAILRATESVSLLQQIIGRGLRLHDGKADCLVLDYGGNIDKHCPDGDLFRPEIKAQYQSASDGTIEAECEQCGYTNTFSPRPNDGEWPIDKYGYFTDLDGERIKNNDGKPIPAHFGRRCCGVTIGKREPVRCGYFWSCKICPECEADNDIAARYCSSCKAELIDPNEKLIADFKALKRSPNAMQTDEVLQMDVLPTTSQKGERMIRVEFVTPARKFAVFFMPDSKSAYVRTQWANFEAATGGNKPRTVTYKKEDSGFYRVLDVDHPTDKERLDAALAANLAKAAA